MRVIFDDELKSELPSDVLIDRMQKATRKLVNGKVVRDGSGFHFEHRALPGGQYYFHEGPEDYSKLSAGNLRPFPGLYQDAQDIILNDGVPTLFRQPLLRLMATNEHVSFLKAATVKLPGYIMSQMPPEAAEIGAWGTFDYEAVRRTASSRNISIEECLKMNIPRLTRIDGHDVLLAPTRANRPMKKGPEPEDEIFRSNFYAHYKENPEAIADMLFTLVRTGKLDLDRRTIDDVVGDPSKLASFGIGGMIDGYGILLSFDSAHKNREFSLALDHSLSTVANIRDISPLGLVGVRAVSIVNMFSPLVRNFDPRLLPHLENIGYRLDGTGENSVPQGIAIVTYSTGFERGIKEKTSEGYTAMLKSQQLTTKRVIEETGWKNIAIVIGQNVGYSASSGYWHTQMYLIKNEGITPKVRRIQSKKTNELYSDGGVRLVAFGYGQVAIQLRTDGDHYERSFLDRESHELESLGRGIHLNEAVLHLMGFRDRSDYTRGNDFGNRVVAPDEMALRIGFGEMALRRRIITSPEQVVPVREYLQGDFQQFVDAYRGTLKNFLYGKIALR